MLVTIFKLKNGNIQMNNLDIKFSKVRDVKSPVRAHDTDAGIDFFIPEDFEKQTVLPNQSITIPSGIKVSFNDGHALIAFNKSGIVSKKKLIVGAEVVDSTYEGEVHIDIHNIGNVSQTLIPGMKIVQFILMPIMSGSMIETKEEDLYDSKSERGSGGFGSSGLS